MRRADTYKWQPKLFEQ